MRWWVVWFAASGCAYVSQNQLELKYDNIDADGDGSPGREDCDDDNPLRSPDLPEIIADGIDNDCDGSDNVDADGDQYPRVTRTVYAEMLVANGIVDSVDQVDWPTNVFESPADCEDEHAVPKVGGPAECTEQDVAEERCIAASAINPGRFDQPYDGVDADCDRGNDFDADGDGQMPVGSEPTAVTTYAESIGISIDTSGANAFGDCNDDDDTIFAGAATDEPYDGHDRDCDGSNDFDQDGDGYMPESFTALYATFLENYHPDPANQPAWAATAQFGDCLDQPHPQVSLSPELVYPGATDVSYDGIDADCAGDSDFDDDRDGFTVQGMDAAIEAYRTLWSTGDPPSFVDTLQPIDVEPGDCDDQSITVAPGNLESLGDGSDADCDGANDTTPFAFGNISWDQPGWPRVVRNENHYIIAGNAPLVVRYNATGATTLYEAAPFVTFPTEPSLLPGYKAEPFDVALWANDNPNAVQPLSVGFDMISEANALIVPHSFNTPTNGIYKMAYVQRTYQQLGGSYGATQLAVATNTFVGYDADLDASFVPLDVQTTPDHGWALAVACGGSGRENPFDVPGDPTEVGSEAVVRHMGLRVPFQTGALVNPLDPSSIGDDTLFLGDNTGDVCWMRAYREGASQVATEIHVCDPLGCLEYAGQILEDETPPAGSFTLVGPSPYGGRGIIEGDVHGELLITVEDAGLVLENYDDTTTATLFDTENVLSGDAVIHAGNLYALAVVEGTHGNLVKLAYGPWATPSAWTFVDVPVEDTDPDYVGGIGCVPSTGDPNCTPGRILDPQRVAIHADDDRVVLAVSAYTPAGYVPSSPAATISGSNVPAPQDGIGWAFLEPLPPAD